MESMKRNGLYVQATSSWLWNILRLPLVILLVVLEPAVAFVCGGLALLGMLTTLFFRLIGAPHFPTGTMLAVSLGFSLILVLYESVIRIFSR